MNLYGQRQLIEGIRTVRKNTIVIAEDIPEKDYGYRPTPESRSVAETLVHIAVLARIDRVLHEEKHLSSLEDVDFGEFIAKSQMRRSVHVQSPTLLSFCVLKGKLGINGWSRFRERCWLNK